MILFIRVRIFAALSSVRPVRRLLFLLALLLLGGSLSPADAQGTPVFWYDISLGTPLVDWYNQVARPEDIARAENMTQIGLLDQVRTGRRLMVFKSAAEAEEVIDEITGRVDILGYNLEHGPLNPEDEQNDPLDAILRMRVLADQHGMQLALGPDYRFAESHGPALAPFVDIFVLQVQRAQTDPQAVYEFVVPLVGRLRQANPDLQISVQIRTEGDVVALVDLVESLRPFLDGVSILTSPDTTDVAAALVDELDSREFDGPVPPPPAPPLTEPPPTAVRPGPDPTNGEPVITTAPPKTLPKSSVTGVMVQLRDVAAAVAGAMGGKVLPTDPNNP